MTSAVFARRSLVRFGIVGVASNLALYLVFLLLLTLVVEPLWAAAACYLMGIAVSYLLNRSWSFKSRDQHGKDLPKFLLAQGVGVCSTIFVLKSLLTWLRPEIAQLINIAITAVINYGVLLLLGFGGTRVR